MQMHGVNQILFYLILVHGVFERTNMVNAQGTCSNGDTGKAL